MINQLCVPFNDVFNAVLIIFTAVTYSLYERQAAATLKK